MNVVFLITDYPLHNFIVDEYVRARPEDDVSICRVRLVLRGKGRAETANRILPRLSKRFLGAKALEGSVVATVAVLPKLLWRGAIFRRLSRTAAKLGLAYHVTDDVMSDDTLAFIRRRQPDLCVSLFHQIIRERLIAIPRLGIVNVHPGILPDFKGIQPYFWELSEGSPRAGATIHLVEDEGVDTGRILGATSFPVVPGSSVLLNYRLTVQAAAALLPRCATTLQNGTARPVAQDQGAGAFYRWPDSDAFDRLADRGHAAFRLGDLAAILTGRWDDFRADRSIVHTGAPEIAAPATEARP